MEENKDDVKNILEQEESSSQSSAPAEQKTTTPLVNNTMANPYKDQQYLPGQTIGYGLPTDQKVINYSEANKPVKDYTGLKRKLLLAGIFLIIVAVCSAAYLLIKKFIFS